MVVDSQPYNSVVSRVVNIDSKPIEPVVGRRKIIPDFVLVNNTENDIKFAPTHNSAQSLSKMGDHHIGQRDKTVPNTEYRQNFTWNKPLSQNGSHITEQLSQSEYRSSFTWPQKSKEVPPVQDIEPPIVAERVVPGKAVPVSVREVGAKKSMSISNFGDVGKETPPVPNVEKHSKQSEYSSNFKPFSAYVYVSGSGFMKPQDLNQSDDADKGKNWYSEVEERNKQANQYKTRSQSGHPLASEGLTQIYSQGSLWNNYHVDRNLQALSLATTQKIIEEKKAERAFYSTPKSGQIRQLNSAPPSLRTEVISACSQASVRTKSPHVMNKTNERPRSADKQSKPNAMRETPKQEGKIWLKPKPKTQNNDDKKVVAPIHLPSNNGKNPKSPTDNGEGGLKSPRPTTLATNGESADAKPKEKPPLPTGPIRTTQIKSPEEITGVRSPSPESWTVPIDRNLNWVNGETPRNVDNKYSADMTAIKSAPASALSDELYGPLSL